MLYHLRYYVLFAFCRLYVLIVLCFCVFIVCVLKLLIIAQTMINDDDSACTICDYRMSRRWTGESWSVKSFDKRMPYLSASAVRFQGRNINCMTVSFTFTSVAWWYLVCYHRWVTSVYTKLQSFVAAAVLCVWNWLGNVSSRSSVLRQRGSSTTCQGQQWLLSSRTKSWSRDASTTKIKVSVLVLIKQKS